tara:strand:+ start:1000 stop:1470 length:471 start_codon:yes stop_codon:yes gene_type:complete
MKKPLLLLGAVALSFQLNAQKLWKNEVDDFTGDVKKFTNYYNIATTSVGKIKASAVRINDFYYLKLKSTSDIGCAGARDNYAIIKFTDGTTLKLEKDLAEIDCADSSASLFSISPNGDLANKEIDKIRFRQSKYYTDGNTSGTYSLSQIINVTKNN